MPLWGRKLYQARNYEKNRTLKSPKFKIPFTGEVFDSEKEYKEQLALYQQPLWTCQSTGDSGLKYEEALASEAHHRDLVDQNVPASMQKAILQHIHHTTGTLDSLVEKVEDHFENNFHVGEVVELAKCKGKIIKGKVLQAKTESVDGCNGSPSSDKENHGTESELLRQTKSSKNAVQSYNIQIGGRAGKVISCVPAEDLIRCDDLPPPYLIKLLIQSNALQAGTKANSPWVVSPDVVKALDIRNKLIETMLPSTRISIRGLKGASKRKPTVTSLGGQQQQPTKKRRLENGSCDPVSPSGHTTPTKEAPGGSSTIDIDSEEEPSPEKVYLDHSYSSPNSKTSNSTTSPSEGPRSPPASASRDKPARKQSTLEAAFSAKKKNPWHPLSGGKSPPDTKKDHPKPSQRTTEAKPKKFDKKIHVINVVDSGSSDDSSSEDSDVVLMDLHVKLSPIKNKKLPTPMRKTLADHFLSLSGKKSGAQGADRDKVPTGSAPRKLMARSPTKENKARKGVKGKGKTDKKLSAKEAERTKEDEVCELVTSSDSESSSSGEEDEDSEQGISKVVNKGKRKVLRAKPTSQKAAKATKKAKRDSDRDSGKSPSKSLSKSSKSPLKSPKKLASPKKAAKASPKKTQTKTASTDGGKSLTKSARSSPRKTLSQLALEMKRKKKKALSSKSPAKLGKATPVKGKSPKKAATATGKTSPKENLSGKKTPTKTKVSPKKTPKSKSLKQSTLFKFSSAKKKSQTGDSDDDALILYKLAKPAPTPVTPRDPPIALKLLRAKRQNNRALYTRLVGQAARLLSKKQIQALKPLIQGDVMTRALAIEAKMKWDKMTPEEKAKALEAKKLERIKKREAERRRKQEEEKEKAKRFEDQLLDLKPLVVPKPVPLPEGLPNTLFGDIAMVVEFINCYSDFLMPNDPYPITADSFMKALSCGNEGFGYLSRILVILLKTLLQDQITEEFVELGMKLSDIPVNMHTASELLRLSLLQTDTDADDKNDDDSDISSVNQEEGEFTAPQELVEMLETNEFFSLTPEVKLELMVCLCNRILTTYSLVDYMEDKQRKAAKLWVQKMQTLKEKNNQLKEEKRKRREEREAEQRQKKEEEMKKKENGGDKKTDKKAPQKKGKKEEPKKGAPPPAAPPVVEEPEDLASIVKRRRIRTAQVKREQEEQAKIEQERRRKEQEEQRIMREKQAFEKNFEEGIHLAKQALRRHPIGSDRNHNRYWLFSGMTPGLFVEKGWVSQDIDYTTATSTDGEEGMDNKEMVDGIEKSVPKEGQNLWFQYETAEEFDSLLECLNNTGIRESALYGELQKRYNDIRKLIIQSRRAGPKLRDSDGERDLLDSFKEDLKDIETHVSQGNLGGVANYEKWEKKVDAAKTIKEFVPLLLQSQSSVNGKFLESIMRPPKVKEGEEEPKSEEVTERVQKWREAVRSCVTMSRLHVLLSIFEVCVKWEKSSENAKCKICRKKGDTAQIVLCDECNQPFHLFCLRPALSSFPTAAWKCPSCAPFQQRAGRKRNYKELAGSDSEESEESEEELEEASDSDGDVDIDPECCVCGAQGEEDTVICSKCLSAYHKDCHQPPMRNLPRTEWICYSCRSGKAKRKAPARKGKKRGRASRR